MGLFRIPENTIGAKQWAKIVISVNANKFSGYAFEGEFFPIKQEITLEEGSVVLTVVPYDGHKTAYVYAVKDNALISVIPGGMDWKHIIDLKNTIQNALRGKYEKYIKLGKFEGYADKELKIELEKRGYEVNKINNEEVPF